MIGNASTSRMLVTSVIHTKTGIRISDIPGARILMMVTTKLKPAASDATPSTCKLNAQKSSPCPWLNGAAVRLAYENHPASGTSPTMKPPCISNAPNRKVQYEKAFSRGNATSRAPIISGMRKLKNVAPKGITTIKIIVVACIVNIALKVSGLTRELSDVTSCRRRMVASIPPTRKKAKAVKPYSAAMRLWSTVVNQLHRPVYVVGRGMTPVIVTILFGSSAAARMLPPAMMR